MKNIEVGLTFYVPESACNLTVERVVGYYSEYTETYDTWIYCISHNKSGEVVSHTTYSIDKFAKFFDTELKD